MAIWKREENEPAVEPAANRPPAAPSSSLPPPAPAPPVAKPPSSYFGAQLQVKADIAGDQDVVLDGVLQGSVRLGQHVLTVGPQGQVRANIVAKQVIVMGSLEGDVTASERVEIRRTGAVTGNIRVPRIQIEDGAFLKGRIEAQPPTENLSRPTAPAATSAASPATPASAPASASSNRPATPASPTQPVQAPLLDSKS